MGKGRRNQRNPDYFKVHGGAVEESAAARAARLAFANQHAELAHAKPVAGAKTQPPLPAPRAKVITPPRVTRPARTMKPGPAAPARAGKAGGRTSAKVSRPLSRQVAEQALARKVPSATPASDDGLGLFAYDSAAPRRSVLARAGHLAGRVATFAVGVARAAIDRIRPHREE